MLGPLRETEPCQHPVAVEGDSHRRSGEEHPERRDPLYAGVHLNSLPSRLLFLVCEPGFK